MKYKVKYVGKIVWLKEVDIKNDADPYPEIDAIELDREDGIVDPAYIEAESVKPIVTVGEFPNNPNT